MFQNSSSAAASPNGGQAASRVLTSGDLREWAKAAQPNARLIYAHGVQWEQSCPSELRDQVNRLQVAGLATSHFVRGRGGAPDHHLLQRTQRPYLKGMQL